MAEAVSLKDLAFKALGQRGGSVKSVPCASPAVGHPESPSEAAGEAAAQPVRPAIPLPSLVTEGAETRWPAESLDTERRFRHPPAKLFPFIGRKVRTPEGPGTLIQVFRDRVTVVLDAELSKCRCFAPSEIEPANWSL